MDLQLRNAHLIERIDALDVVARQLARQSCKNLHDEELLDASMAASKRLRRALKYYSEFATKYGFYIRS